MEVEHLKFGLHLAGTFGITCLIGFNNDLSQAMIVGSVLQQKINYRCLNPADDYIFIIIRNAACCSLRCDQSLFPFLFLRTYLVIPSSLRLVAKSLIFLPHCLDLL